MARRSIEKSERCPHCGVGRVFTIDSRYSPSTQARRRRYQCQSCDKRYSTYEVSAVRYEKLLSMKINPAEFDAVIATLRAIKVQLGDSNGLNKNKN